MPTLVNSKRAREVRYEAIKNALEPYGLTLTRLINNEILEKNEPIWIHQCDVNPHDFFPILSSRDTSEKEELGGDDPRFSGNGSIAFMLAKFRHLTDYFEVGDHRPTRGY